MLKNCRRRIAILLTPHTPGLIFFVLIALTLLSSHSTKAQDTLRLKELPVYEASLKQYYSRKWQVDQKEFTQINRKKWWYYLPSVGIQFGMPSVQFGTGTLAQIDRDKATSRAKLEAMEARARLEYNEALLQLRVMYRKLRIEMLTVENDDWRLLPVIYGRIIDIHNEAFNDQKMTPLEHLTKNVEDRRRRLTALEHITVLRVKVLELEEFAHYGLTDNSLSVELDILNRIEEQ